MPLVGKFLEKKENEEKSKKSLKNSTLIDQIKTTLLSKNQNGRLDEKNEAIFSFEEILNLYEKYFFFQKLFFFKKKDWNF